LEGAWKLGGRDPAAIVGDREDGALGPGACRDGDPTVGNVVPNRVRDEVGDEPLEVGVARGHRRLERHDGRERAPVQRSQRVICDRREVDRLGAPQSVAAPCESKTRVEQALLLLARAQDTLADLSPDGNVGARVP
jgi:hypothetical protein